jgi:hypothetical protein
MLVRTIFTSLLLCFFSTAFGQYYMFGGYNFAAINLKGSNEIINTFNNAENHSVAALRNNWHGYRAGFGHYSRHALVELAYGNLVSQQLSINTDQLKERAEVIANYASVSARVGYKPFIRQHFTVGAALHLGNVRYRYSFGGNYQTPITRYTIVPEVYLDYAIRLRFLLKKAQRNDYFYLLRIRPSYQFHATENVAPFAESLNQTPRDQALELKDNFSHFGFTVSLVIPFMNDDERGYLIKNKEKRSKKSKQPKGRL